MPTTIKFVYDPQKDARNAWESLNHNFDSPVKHLFGDSFANALKGCSWANVAPFAIVKHRKFAYKHTKFISAVLSALDSYWLCERPRIIATLENIFPAKPVFPDMVAYLTSCSRCPYEPSKNSFMISILASPPQAVYTIAHEMFHLQFWHSLRHRVNQCGAGQCAEFTEIMTAILDNELSDSLLIRDARLSNSTGLRQKIQQLWKSRRDIDWVAGKVLNDLY